MKELQAVQRYWDDYPCGIDVTDQLVGTQEFFDDIKNAYAHSDALLNFRGYEGRSVLEIGCGLGFDYVSPTMPLT